MSDLPELAVIGIGCRFPDANTSATFHANLLDKHTSLRRFEREELLASGVSPLVIDEPTYVPFGSSIADAELFDAAFFGLTDREAATADPQQRVLMKCVWEAFEDAGHVPSRCHQTGVFVSSAMSSYFYQKHAHRVDLARASSFLPHLIASDKDYLSSRIAYAFNFQGPALTVQTACSSSLVAVTLACDALLSHAADFAVAGGVSIRLPLRAGYVYEEGGILARDGRCRPFDRSASGTVFGQGAAAVVLRRLSDALADGDRIYAVVRGYATNNDGSDKVGYTAPSVAGQVACVSAALAHAAVDASDIRFVECHGTGTLVGDAIEVQALKSAFRAVNGRCAIGSVKSNVGHLDVAAGIAGFIKAALALHHRMLPPLADVEQAAPALELDDGPFELALRVQSLPGGALAGVSSFGIGGTNAHVVLQGHEAGHAQGLYERRHPVFMVSARSHVALRHAAADLSRWSGQHEANLLDGALTSTVGRERFAFSRALVADSPDALRTALKRIETDDCAVHPVRRQVAFAFTGQGSEYEGMGLGLYRDFSGFRAAFEECDRIVCGLVGRPLKEICFNAGGQLEIAELCQLAIFGVEFSLCRLLESFGVVPSVVAGHSLGEVVAASLAGMFSLEEALSFVYRRGRAMREHSPSGGSLVCRRNVTEIRALVEDGRHDVFINGMLGPEHVSVAGPLDALSRFEQTLKRHGIRATRTSVQRPFHTPLMRDAVAALRAGANGFAPRGPVASFVETAGCAERSDSAEYWFRQISEPVVFSRFETELAQRGIDVVVELGATPHLTALAKEQGVARTWIPSLRPGTDGMRSIAGVLAQLADAGVEIDWNQYYHGSGAVRCALPTYRFEERRCWIDEDRPASNLAVAQTRLQPLAVAGFRLVADVCERSDRRDGTRDHVIRGGVLFPAVGYLAILREAFPEGALCVEDLVIEEVWPIGDEPWRLQLQVREAAAHEAAEVRFLTRDGERFRPLAQARIRVGDAEPLNVPTVSVDSEWTDSDLYARFREHGIEYGSSFQLLGQHARAHGQARARLKQSAEILDLTGLLDTALQATALASEDAVSTLYLPTRIGRCVFGAAKSMPRLVEATTQVDATANRIIAQAALRDERGQVCVALAGIECRPADRATMPRPRTYVREWSEAEPAALSQPLAVDLLLLPASLEHLASSARASLAPKGCIALARGLELVASDGSPLTIEALLEELSPTERPFTLVDLRGLEPSPNFERTHACFALLRALAHRSRKTRCVIATRGAVSTARSKVTDPVSASLWGLSTSAALELSDLELTLVDADPSLPPETALDAALSELGVSVELHVARRGTQRLTPHLVARARAEAPHAIGALAAFREDGCTIVTGASGGLAAPVTQWLVSRGVRHLVLVGGTRVPDGHIEALSARGIRVDVASADLTDRYQIDRLIEVYREQKIPIRSVVHLAGKTRDGLLSKLKSEDLDAVLGPKALSIRLLHEATLREGPLFVCFSSLGSVLGSPGQVNYAAANSFLDAFASFRASQGLPTVSIAWGPWDAPGMAQRVGLERFRRLGLAPLSSEAALEALGYLDARDETSLVAAVHWATVARLHGEKLGRLLPIDTKAHGRLAKHAGFLRTELVEAVATRRERLLANHIRETVAIALGMKASDIGDHSSMLDLGLDSLATVELRGVLEHALDVPVPVSAFFDHVTPAALARRLLSDLFDASAVPPSLTPTTVPPARETGEDLLHALRARLSED